MQRTDEFRSEDLIDLGAVSVETKGGEIKPQEDTVGSDPAFRLQAGLSAD